MPTNDTREDILPQKRRKFLLNIVKTACGVSLAGAGIGMHSKLANAMPAESIRPPGALPEDEFMSHCIRCGLCVRDCPYDILKLSELGDEPPLGTPYFTARTGPCEMCPDIPCVAACPTNALDHELTDIYKSKMGLAVLVDQEECIAFQGLRCEVCFNVCPIQGEAISLEYRHNNRSGKHAVLLPIVHSSDCTGCGKCEQACVMEEATIKIFPFKLAKGQLGEHYRFGWEQKDQAGGSLVSPDPEHKINLPEGVIYNFNKGGLQLNDDKKENKNVNNALKALKRGLE